VETPQYEVRLSYSISN